MRLGLTTHEDCKYFYDGGQGSPFSLFSYWANLKRTVFRRFGKKLFDPELMYKPVEKPAFAANEEATDHADNKKSPDKEKNDAADENQIEIVIDNDK